MSLSRSVASHSGHLGVVEPSTSQLEPVLTLTTFVLVNWHLFHLRDYLRGRVPQS